MSEWTRDGDNYQAMISRALEAKGKQPINLLLFYQGESDALHEDTAASYQEKLDQLLRDVRLDLAQVRQKSGPHVTINLTAMPFTAFAYVAALAHHSGADLGWARSVPALACCARGYPAPVRC